MMEINNDEFSLFKHIESEVDNPTIYNEFKNDRYTHDDFFEKKPFPSKRNDGRFIGERIDSNDNPLTDDYRILL